MEEAEILCEPVQRSTTCHVTWLLPAVFENKQTFVYLSRVPSTFCVPNRTHLHKNIAIVTCISNSKCNNIVNCVDKYRKPFWPRRVKTPSDREKGATAKVVNENFSHH